MHRPGLPGIYPAGAALTFRAILLLFVREDPLSKG